MSTSVRKRMSLLDATFLRMETREAPMHVASPLYLNGARLEAFYPVSIPSQRLALYAGEALDELEAALAPPVRTTPRKRTLETVN